MRQTLEFLFAVAGALLAIFYLGSIASDTFIATRTFDSSEDVMTQHSIIYLITIGACVIGGWLVGRIIGVLFCRS